jgi:hypothetical protein
LIRKRGEIFLDGDDPFSSDRGREAQGKAKATGAERRRAQTARPEAPPSPASAKRTVRAVRLFTPGAGREADPAAGDDGRAAPRTRSRKPPAAVSLVAEPSCGLPVRIAGLEPLVPLHSVARPIAFRADAGTDSFLFVGIDAGTSGIRVGVRDVFEAGTRLYDFGANEAGGTRFSFPAVAAVVDGRLRFGNEATAAPREARFASFKGGFVHRHRDGEIRDRWRSLRLPGWDSLCGEGLPSITDFLYAVTVARALELALPRLAGGADALENAHLSFGVGAPVGDDPQEGERYRRALGCAVGLFGAVGARPPLQRLLRNFAHVWYRSLPLCSREAGERRLHVRHEVDSAIRPFERLLTFGSNFLIADIGATTTEVAVLRIGKETVSCYASRSVAIGIDDFDRAVAHAAKRDTDVVHERRSRSQPRSWSALERQQRERAGKAVADELTTALRGVLHQAVQVNPSEIGWRGVQVVIAGGGSHLDALRAVFAKNALPHPFIQHRNTVDIRLAAVEVRGASAKSPVPTEFPELVSVLGSSVPPWEGRAFRTPDQVEAVVPDSLRSRWEVDHSAVK